MCISPIKVKIKRIDSVVGFARSEYKVPCGKCWQCRLNKQNSYFVRNFYQWMLTKQNKGYSAFLTLTYSPEYLPTTKYYKIPVFNKPDVQKYIKRVRKRVSLIVAKALKCKVQDAQKVVAGNLSYFVVSENGEHTHRPHYHIIWYMHKPLISYFQFAHIIKDAWKLGFTRLGDNFGLINSEAGIKYVCKYIGKTFVQDSYFNDVVNSLRYVLDAKSLDEESIYVPNYQNNYIFKSVYNDFKTRHDLKEFQEKKPFLLLSKNFGMFAFDTRCPAHLRLSVNDLVHNTLNINASDYAIPEYYRRKNLYDVRKVFDDVSLTMKVQFALNSSGAKVHTSAFDRMLQAHKERVVETISDDFINVRSIRSFNRRYKYDYTIPELRGILKQYVFDKDFIDYSFVFQHYKYLVPLFDCQPERLVTSADCSQFFDLFNSSSPDAITSSNYDSYLPYLQDVAETALWYDVVHPQYKTICDFLDYFRNYYGRITQAKSNLQDSLNKSRKIALGVAL